jgi:hypothetical protein
MRFYITLAALAVAITVAGCKSVPILNVSEAPTVNAQGKVLSKDEVRAAIFRAGSALGWQMRDEGANMVVGSISLRRHAAVVEIPYSGTSYSIKYRSSENLEQRDGGIHKNYNSWVQNLRRGINDRLAAS